MWGCVCACQASGLIGLVFGVQLCNDQKANADQRRLRCHYITGHLIVHMQSDILVRVSLCHRTDPFHLNRRKEKQKKNTNTKQIHLNHSQESKPNPDQFCTVCIPPPHPSDSPSLRSPACEDRGADAQAGSPPPKSRWLCSNEVCSVGSPFQSLRYSLTTVSSICAFFPYAPLFSVCDNVGPVRDVTMLPEIAALTPE